MRAALLTPGKTTASPWTRRCPEDSRCDRAAGPEVSSPTVRSCPASSSPTISTGRLSPPAPGRENSPNLIR